MRRIVLSSLDDRPVVVTGATGALGTALLELLNAPITECQSDDIRTCDWDAILPDQSIVFHLAACVHRPYASLLEHTRTNTFATLRLASSCIVHSCKLIHASTIAAAAPERSPYAASKALAEETLKTLAANGLAATSLRFPLLYGRRGRGNMERLMRAIGQGRYIPLGSPCARKTCLDFRDAAASLLYAARADFHGRILAVPGTTHSLREITNLAYSSWGKTPPPFWIPTGVSQFTSAVLNSVVPGLPACRSLRTLLRSEEVDVRDPDTLPFEAKVCLADGLADLARALSKS